VITSLRRLIAGAVVAAALTLAGVGAGDAWAHPTLVATDPASQTTVSASPASITLVFNEAVTFAHDAITLFDASGRQVPVAAASSERDGTAMTTRPQRPLAPGTYTVRWRVTGSDGDETEEEFGFAVGVALTPSMGLRAHTGPDWGTSLLRWLLLTGLAVAVGALVAQRATDAAREQQPALPRLRSWAPAGMAMALVAVIGLLAQRVSAAGDFAAAWQGRAGAVLLVQGAGLLTAATMVRFGRWALAPLAIGIAAEGIRSHATINHGPWAAVLIGVHLAAVTVWAGALLHTTRAVLAWRHEGAAARSVLMRYVRIALWAYLVVVATGILTALTVISLSQLTSTTYGRVLLIKLGLVAAASLTALAGRLVQRDSLRISLLGNVMRVETGLLAAVLATSALLISTPPPSDQAPITDPQPAAKPR
jgi:copper transport protein